MKPRQFVTFALLAAAFTETSAAVVAVGAGSYSDAFPGVDAAGRNGFIATAPYVTGAAAERPVPTNDWWSNELVQPHSSNTFNYPLGLRSEADGLVIIKNMVGQAMLQGDTPLKVSVAGLNADTRVSDYSDWTVTFDWDGRLRATVAQASPFVYFTTTPGQSVTIAAMGTMTAQGNILTVTGGYNQATYAVYAPTGAAWNVSGSRATTTLAGKGYLSVAMLPEGVAAADWERFAFVFPADTRAEYVYNVPQAEVITTYTVTPDVKEGSESAFLMGLLPHHWANLSAPLDFEPATFATVRGQMKLLAANSFSTRLAFHGILPTLPAVDEAASTTGFDPQRLAALVAEVVDDDGLDPWTDSYNDGLLLGRLMQTARVAKLAGLDADFGRSLEKIRARIENWLTYAPGEVAFMYYYQPEWTTLLGYPAGHGQDTNINDHHFHWGYLIAAAALVEQHRPGWAERFGPMIDLLVRDAASPDRDDTMFPYLRNFSPYSGHSWANGTANMGLGCDQESTSESIQFAASLINWGAVTANTVLRDLGVYLYVTEISAAREYWFDVDGRNLGDGWPHALASRVFTNGYDAENFWGGGMGGSYGIQIYPVQAASFYLVYSPDYARRLWQAMTSETGIARYEANDNIWYDTWARFYAMVDSEAALAFYNACPQLNPAAGQTANHKFGESGAHTYQWVHAMAQYGTPDMTATADWPLAAVFDRNGVRTYAAQNYGSEPLTVTFSDGYTLHVPAGEMAWASDGTPLPVQPSATVTADPANAEEGQNVVFTAAVAPGDYDISAVTLMLDSEPLQTSQTSENTYTAEWTAVAGTHTVAVKIETDGETFTAGATEYAVGATSGPVAGAEFAFGPDDAIEGAFSGPYTVRFRYADSRLTVHAAFEGDYTGFAGPWLHNKTDGFAETDMHPDADGYVGEIAGPVPGKTYSVSVKVAYAGGLGISPVCSFTVPEVSGIADESVRTAEEAVYYNLQGIRVANPSGGVFIRVAGGHAAKVAL